MLSDRCVPYGVVSWPLSEIAPARGSIFRSFRHQQKKEREGKIKCGDRRSTKCIRERQQIKTHTRREARGETHRPAARTAHKQPSRMRAWCSRWRWPCRSRESHHISIQNSLPPRPPPSTASFSRAAHRRTAWNPRTIKIVPRKNQEAVTEIERAYGIQETEGRWKYQTRAK